MIHPIFFFLISYVLEIAYLLNVYYIHRVIRRNYIIDMNEYNLVTLI